MSRSQLRYCYLHGEPQPGIHLYMTRLIDEYGCGLENRHPQGAVWPHRHLPGHMRYVGRATVCSRQHVREQRLLQSEQRITNGSHDQIKKSGMPDRRLGHDRRRMTNAACIHALHTTASASQAKVSEYISGVRNKQGRAAAQQHLSK
jgi:hypothetical protein